MADSGPTPPGTRVLDSHAPDAPDDADLGAAEALADQTVRPGVAASASDASIAYSQLQAVGADRSRRTWRVIATGTVLALGFAVAGLMAMVLQGPTQLPAPPADTTTLTEWVTTTEVSVETATSTTTATTTALRTSRVTDVRTEVTREVRTATVTATVTVAVPVN